MRWRAGVGPPGCFLVGGRCGHAGGSACTRIALERRRHGGRWLGARCGWRWARLAGRRLSHRRSCASFTWVRSRRRRRQRCCPHGDHVVLSTLQSRRLGGRCNNRRGLGNAGCGRCLNRRRGAGQPMFQLACPFDPARGWRPDANRQGSRHRGQRDQQTGQDKGRPSSRDPLERPILQHLSVPRPVEHEGRAFPRTLFLKLPYGRQTLSGATHVCHLSYERHRKTRANCRRSPTNDVETRRHRRPAASLVGRERAGPVDSGQEVTPPAPVSRRLPAASGCC